MLRVRKMKPCIIWGEQDQIPGDAVKIGRKKRAATLTNCMHNEETSKKKEPLLGFV